MSGNGSDDNRTEEATEQRVAKALEEGDTPATPEAASFATIAAAALVAVLLAGAVASSLGSRLAGLVEAAGSERLSAPADAAALVTRVLSAALADILPVLALCAAVGVGCALMQGHARAAAGRLTPKLQHVSPVAGMKRIFGQRALLQLAKSILKCAIVMVIALWTVWRDKELYEALLSMPVYLLPSEIARRVGGVLVILAVIAGVLFVADLALAHFLWRRGLRMTRDEVSRDRRESEGEPLLKARRRAIGRRRARQRMLAAVPRATMVVVNPTHFAVALRYVHTESRAPEVVAKGQDLVALAIRRVAEEHRIPVIEDRGLARSLYQKVELEQLIPPEFYRAIAAIVAALDRKRGPGGSAPG